MLSFFLPLSFNFLLFTEQELKHERHIMCEDKPFILSLKKQGRISWENWNLSSMDDFEGVIGERKTHRKRERRRGFD